MVLDSNVHKLKVHLKSGTLHLHQQLTIFFVYFVSNVHNSSEKVKKDNCNVYKLQTCHPPSIQDHKMCRALCNTSTPSGRGGCQMNMWEAPLPDIYEDKIRRFVPSFIVCRTSSSNALHTQWFAGLSGRAVYGAGLQPLACWDCGFESHRGHGCLPVVRVLCCQVEVSAKNWSLVQRSPTDCDASLSVIKKPQKNEKVMAHVGPQRQKKTKKYSRGGRYRMLKLNCVCLFVVITNISICFEAQMLKIFSARIADHCHVYK